MQDDRVRVVAWKDRCILWAEWTLLPATTTVRLHHLTIEAHHVVAESVHYQKTLRPSFLSILFGSSSRLPAGPRAPCIAVPADAAIR